MICSTPQKYTVFDGQNAPEVWHSSVNPNLYVDNGNMIGFSFRAMASKWGRREVWLAFRAAKGGLKTNPRTLTLIIDGLYRTCPWVPEATRIPKFDIFGTLWSILRGLTWFFEKKILLCVTLVEIAKLATLV